MAVSQKRKGTKRGRKTVRAATASETAAPNSEKLAAISEKTAKPKRGSGKPFAKGVSGNPTGRPKQDPEVKALARDYTKEAIERLVHWMRSDEPKASVQASNAILDRAWGKAPQAITGEDDGPLIVQIVRFSEAAHA